MKQLILVRHGEPDMQGTAPKHDPSLSALGRQQAELTCAALTREPIDEVVSSPLRRAWETAEPLSARMGKDIAALTGMAEVDQEGAAYVSVEQWRKEGGRDWQAFLANPVVALGGDHAAFVARVHNALEHLMAMPGKRIAVFTHGLPINVALSAALGEGSLARFGPRHASITRMAGKTLGDLRLLSFNEAAHITARRA